MKTYTKIILFTCIASLIGCKTKTVYVPVREIQTEIEMLDRWHRDSIYILDSVFLYSKNDTVFLNKYKTIYKEVVRVDSIRKDSIVYKEIPIPVDVPVAYYPTWMIVLAIIGGGGIGYVIFRLYKLF